MADLTKTQFVPVDQLPIVQKVRQILQLMADNLPAALEQVIEHDMHRLKILIDAKIATLPATEQATIRKALDGAMDRKRDARRTITE